MKDHLAPPPESHQARLFFFWLGDPGWTDQPLNRSLVAAAASKRTGRLVTEAPDLHFGLSHHIKHHPPFSGELLVLWPSDGAAEEPS